MSLSASSVSEPASVSDPGHLVIVGGPQWYRHHIRVWGHWLGLLLPGSVGVIAYGSLQLFDTAWSGIVGLVGGVLAAPALLFVGAPFGDRDDYPLAVLVSAVLWMVVGFIAARRATKNPTADWSDYWRHYLAILAGIWVGAGIALAIAAASIGDSIFDW